MAKTAEATTKVTRPRKTAAEKAQADLDKATKRLETAQARLSKVQGTIDAAETEVFEAQRQLDYVSRNPALPSAQITIPDDAEQLASV